MLLLCGLFMLFCFRGHGQSAIVHSPDHNIKLEVLLQNGRAFYRVFYQNDLFVLDSPLGLLSDEADFTKNLKFIGKTSKTIHETYTLNRSKFSKVDYKANELKCSFVNYEKEQIEVIFRVSDSDIAFCYSIPKSNKNNTLCRVKSEITGFRIPQGSTTFLSPQAAGNSGWKNTKPSYEEEYTQEEPLETKSKYGLGYTYPALFHLGSKGWMLISETGVDQNYVGTRLSDADTQGLYTVCFPQQSENNTIGDCTASAPFPFQTSWKTITIGKTLKPIVESTVSTDVVKPLFDSPKTFSAGRASWSWILWQDASCNYEDQIKYIDLASALKCEYILIDALWDVNIGRERMVDLVNYAKSKNVSVLLWYNSNGAWNNAPMSPKNKMNTHESRLEEMAWLEKIGVKGMKVDFFGGDKQQTMKLYHDILTDAATYGLNVNFHGTTLPRGWERMYPNYMTSEAVLASENLVFGQDFCDRYANTASIYPFTRNAVSAMDFGPVFLNNRFHRDADKGSIRKTTDAFEMATSVIFFSPLQHWGIAPNNLSEKPSFLFDFLKELPTVWDESRFIDGYPGKYCVLARRKGDKWYIAAINGEGAQKNIRIHLPMLKNKRVYLISDALNGTAVFSTKSFGNDDLFELELAKNGGMILYMP